MRIILLMSVKYSCCVGTQEKWQRNMNRKICPIEKKTLNLQLLSWKQSFYLKKTNTYWRYRAIACEGHRFIFCMIHTTSYCKSHMPAPWAQCLLSLIGITFLLLARHTQMSCQRPIISELPITVPRFLAKSHYYFHLFIVKQSFLFT